MDRITELDKVLLTISVILCFKKSKSISSPTLSLIIESKKTFFVG